MRQVKKQGCRPDVRAQTLQPPPLNLVWRRALFSYILQVITPTFHLASREHLEAYQMPTLRIDVQAWIEFV